jgi:hypothetical protein
MHDCKFCGAGFNYPDSTAYDGSTLPPVWHCGTVDLYEASGPRRSSACYEAEIRKLRNPPTPATPEESPI